MAPWFSIVLPVYNVKAYLERCVQSILSQNFEEYEIILVDDGSTDGCTDLCDRLASVHSCIQVIHKENGGLSSARNAGMEAARGQYIWFVDSDDWIEPGALDRLYKTTEKQRTDIVKFQHFRVTGDQNIPVLSNAEPGMYTGEESCVLLHQACCSAGKFVLSAWSHLYSRDFLRKWGLQFVSERLIASEDYLFNLQAYLMAQRVCVIGDKLYRYELRPGSLSQTYKRDLPEKYTKLYHCLRQYYAHSGLLARYDGWLSAFYLWHLLRGTCIPNAYGSTKDHTVEQGRIDVREFLSAEAVEQAYKRCEKKAFSPKQRVLLWAMEKRLEPVFYWLYVVKPRKKGNRNENQA
ncbi:MAG: glycosyltransferase [Oscillospiraceae bacterium]|nr:glycosyltransferase [Oscillospiraceae bacterium]